MPWCCTARSQPCALCAIGKPGDRKRKSSGAAAAAGDREEPDEWTFLATLTLEDATGELQVHHTCTPTRSRASDSDPASSCWWSVTKARPGAHDQHVPRPVLEAAARLLLNQERILGVMASMVSAVPRHSRTEPSCPLQAQLTGQAAERFFSVAATDLEADADAAALVQSAVDRVLDKGHAR